jgi:hypothetical protein
MIKNFAKSIWFAFLAPFKLSPAKLDKMLVKARREGMLRAAEIADKQAWAHGGRHFNAPEMNSTAIAVAIRAEAEMENTDD